MRPPRIALVALALAACAGHDPAAPEGREAAAVGQVQFGLVADGASGVITASYLHWDAEGAWAVPREEIWTLELPLLTCRVAQAERSVDGLGFPAAIVTLTDEDAARFGDLTTRSIGRRLAVLVDGQVVLTPTVAEPLAARFELSGRFSEEDVRRLLEHLQPPSS